MKETAAESADLKVRLKNYFAVHGIDAPMPEALAREAHDFPQEYGEACEEFERWGWEVTQ